VSIVNALYKLWITDPTPPSTPNLKKKTPLYSVSTYNKNFEKIVVKILNMYTRNVLDLDCQTQGRLKLMTELYISEICHKFQ
jgi:hypothetical protein